ncbi:MAG: response regulator [Nitrospirota bacterium]|jgi:two-component system chemotaxis response regulator CheY
MQRMILIVDDSASMRQLMAFTLQDAGYGVLEAADGMDAVQKAREASVDLVITDLHMPEMDGFGLIEALKGLPEYRYKPIIMLTTESAESKKHQGKLLGASGWIVKPFTPEQLVRVVEKFVR